MAENNSTDVGGIFCVLLTTLFIGLKLGGIINWSWWWVTSPLWIGALITIIILIIVIIIIKILK